MNRDIKFMNRCIELAASGLGFTAPNPLVGCVITHRQMKKDRKMNNVKYSIYNEQT